MTKEESNIPEFNPQSLVELAAEVAEEHIESMTAQDKISCLRTFYAALVQSGIITLDDDDPECSIELAIKVLTVAQIVPRIFPSAYKTSAIEVDLANDKDSVVDSLNRSLDL